MKLFRLQGGDITPSHAPCIFEHPVSFPIDYDPKYLWAEGWSWSSYGSSWTYLSTLQCGRLEDT